MRKPLLAVAVTTVILLAICGSYVGGVHLTHRRDEDAFMRYIADNATIDSGAASQTLPPRAVLVAEGQRACDWLNGQPHALWRTGERYKPQVLMNRYVTIALARSAPSQVLPEVPVVVSAAWKYLCSASVELRRPLPGFRGATD